MAEHKPLKSDDADLTGTSQDAIREFAASDTLPASNLPVMVGDSGSGGTKGAVPAPGAGDTAAGKYLKADGTWDTPSGSGSGDVTGPASATDNALPRFHGTTGKVIQSSTASVDDSGNLDVQGNVTVSGTVDGVDVAGLDSTVTTHTGAASPHSGHATLSGGKVPVGELPALVGDSGAGGTAGIVPAPAAGDAAAGKYLDADGTWTVPPGAGGSGDVTGPGTSTAGTIPKWADTTGDVLTDGVAAPTGAIVGTTDAQTLTNKTLTTPTVGDFSNAGHDHEDAAGGGTLDAAALGSGVIDTARLASTGTANSSTFLRGDQTWATPAGSGDVSGPGSSTAGNVPTYADTSGTLLDGGFPVSAAAKTVLDDASVSAMVDTLGGASATGTGGLVRATSPALTTPNLGTPSALTLTNATGLPTAGLVDEAVTLAKIQHIATDSFLGRDTATTGDVEVLSASAARGILNVEDGATADQTGAEIKALYEAEADTNAFTDTEKSKLAAITGTNTGDQTITLTGDVTGSGTGSFAATIAANSVGLTKLADIATDRLLGRDTAASGDPEEISVGGGLEFTGTGGIQRSALTGDVTASAGSGTTTIANNAVTVAKMQQITGVSVLGRSATSGPGNMAAIALTNDQILGRNGAGTLGGITISALTEETTPAAGDWLLGMESGGGLRKFDVGDLPSGGGGDTLPVVDTTAIAKGSVDDTKQVRLEVDGLTAATTRVLTVPDHDGTIVTEAGTQTLSNKTLTAPDIGTPSAGTLTNCTGLPTAGLVDGAVTYAKIQDVSATDRLLGRSTAGAGDVEEIACTAFARQILDDADAATARATLDVDQAGTDNSTDVTLAGTPDYITISGQVITRNAVDLAADVTGTLPVANGGTGSTTSTGSGAVVLATSPTLVTPALGTPASGILTNCTSLPATALAVTSSDVLIGRDSASGGASEQIAVGGGLEFTGTQGIQRSALTGDVTASAGSGTTTIANDAVTTAKIADGQVTLAKLANIATDSFIGRDTAATGVPEVLSAATARTILNVEDGATANVGALADLDTVGTTQIDNSAVTNAKMANMAEATIKGRRAGTGTGAPEDLTASQVQNIILPLPDSSALVKGSVDATKLLRIEVDGFTAATTRVLTAPDYDGTIATLAGTETLTNKTLTSPTLTTPALGTPSSGTLTNCTGLPNAGLSNMNGYTIKARNNLATGAPQDVGVADLTEETTPAAGDFLLGWESGGNLRKFDVGDLPGGGGGDVSGPGSSTDGFIPKWSGTGGDTLAAGVAAPTGAIVGTSDTQTLTNKTLTTPTVGDFTNATHSHTNAAGGGSLDAAAIGSGTVATARLGSGTASAVTFLRGDQTYAALSTFVTLGSDVTSTLTNTFEDVTGLSFSVASGETYWFKFTIGYGSSATGNGSRWSVNGPAFTSLFYVHQYATSGTAHVAGWQNTYDTGDLSTGSGASGNMAFVEGTITPSASGTLILRFASEAVTSNTITAKVGSFLQWRRIA